jgi:fatty acid elongase 3
MATESPLALFEKLPVPTLDRPFGIHLWPIFNKAFELVVGYPADDFRFQPGVTPMSTLKETSIFIVIYYTIIFGGRELMRNREPFKLRSLFLIHNFYLTAISAILLALFIEQMLPTVVRHGIFHAICAREGGWTQPMVVLYYVSRMAAHASRPNRLVLTRIS